MTRSVDQAAFRGALGRFASGVTVVSTVVEDIDHAMTASAFTSVSLDPPLVLMCSHKTSRFHDAVLRTGVWGVSILAEEARGASSWFSQRGRPLEDQFKGFDSRRAKCGVLLLVDALAWLECETTSVHDGGDHTIVVGTVTNAEVRDDLDDPLLYYRSHYGTIVRSDKSEKSLREEISR